MGLFDKFSKSSDIFPKNELEAWMGIFYACISADDDVDDSELEALVELISKKEKFSSIDDLVPLYKRAANAKSTLGGDDLIKACCPVIDIEYKPTIFSMAVELVFADGTVESEEEQVIELIAKELGIAPDLATKIIDVIIIKNKGNVN